MMKIIQEFDFFDDRRPRRYVLFRSTPFLEEINFWDENDKRPKIHYLEEEISFPGIDQLGSSSISSSSVMVSSSVSCSKRARSSITTFQESSHHDGDSDDDLQETTHHKKRKISTTLRLFGTECVVEEKDDWDRRWKAKGKGKVIDELSEPDYNSQIFSPMFEDGYDDSGALIIYEPSDKKKEKKKAQPRKSNKKSTEQQQEEASAPLPPLMQQEIKKRGGSDPIFLFAKDLTYSDVARNLSRLFINHSKKLMEALTEEEQKMVENEEYYSGLRVFTMDDRHHDYKMQLTRWNVGAYKTVLKTEWMKFVRANNLQEGDRVEGWGFRKNGEFYLALNLIRKVA